MKGIEMTPELKQEKAIQHIIVYAQFLAKEICNGNAESVDLLVAASARAYASKHKTTEKPDEWLGVEFSQYMKESCIEQIWPPIEKLGK